MLLQEVCDKAIDYSILDPQKRLIGIGDDIAKAGIKGKMPIKLTDADGTKLNVLILMVVAPGMGWYVYSSWKPSLGGLSRTSNKIRALFVVEISPFHPIETGIVVLTRETRGAIIQERQLNSGGYAQTLPRMPMLMLGNQGRSTTMKKLLRSLEVPRVLEKTFGETSPAAAFALSAGASKNSPLEGQQDQHYSHLAYDTYTPRSSWR